MKYQIGIVALLSIFSITQANAEGTRGGGRALVCRDAEGKIASATMLDVLEGRMSKPVGYGLNIVPSKDENLSPNEKKIKVKSLIMQALSKMDMLAVPPALFKSIDEVQSTMLIEPGNFDLVAPEDMGKLHIASKPRGCELEPVGVYFEDDRLHLNLDIFTKLDSLNQSAFFLHEGIYKYFRDTKNDDSGHYIPNLPIYSGSSEPTRNLVAELLADTSKVSSLWVQMFSFGTFEHPYRVAFKFQQADGDLTMLWLPPVAFTVVRGEGDSYQGSSHYQIIAHVSRNPYHNNREIRRKAVKVELDCNRSIHECKVTEEAFGKSAKSLFTRIQWDGQSGPAVLIDDRVQTSVVSEPRGHEQEPINNYPFK